MQVWRICKKKYGDSAFSGEGGLHGPGRWHHQGNRIVYTSQSLALATLETWVHIKPDFPLPNHVQVSAEMPSDLQIHEISEETLPTDWKVIVAPVMELRDIGTKWLKSSSSAVARVPSVITPGEFNYLLNPLHIDFRRIRAEKALAFEYDPRLWKK